jgi:hypothetical protein
MCPSESVRKVGRLQRLSVQILTMVLFTISSNSYAGEKSPVAPHTLRIQHSLQSALKQVQTLRQEVQKASPNDPSQEVQIENTAKAVTSDVGTALAEQNQLQRLSDSYLRIRKSPDYRGLNAALSQLSIDHNNLQHRIDERKFTQNKSEVLKDLSAIQSNLTKGVVHAQKLNRESNAFDAKV